MRKLIYHSGLLKASAVDILLLRFLSCYRWQLNSRVIMNFITSARPMQQMLAQRFTSAESRHFRKQGL